MFAFEVSINETSFQIELFTTLYVKLNLKFSCLLYLVGVCGNDSNFLSDSGTIPGVEIIG